MADFQTCIDWVLDNEDATRACAIVHDPTKSDPSAHAISGVNSAAWPKEYQLIAALSQTDRLPAVEAFYRAKFWNQWYEQLVSDEVAKRVLDMAVNGGSGTAVRLLQSALNVLQFPSGGQLASDGIWGPRTVAACNQDYVDALVSAFRQQRNQYYRKIGGLNVQAWLARAAK